MPRHPDTPLFASHAPARRAGPHGWASLAWVLLAALPALATAQTVFRTVGPDGRVSFSDRPPARAGAPAQPGTPPPSSAPATPTASQATGLATGLPYELGQIVRRYPFTLYTMAECIPCTEARQFLSQRGVPFTERSVSTAADQQVLRQLSGQASVPFATLGSQHLQGFSASTWTEYLNAAGYPALSQLPAHYKQAAAQPLTTPAPAVAATPAPAQASEDAPRPRPGPAAPPPPGVPTRDNPAGLRF